MEDVTGWGRLLGADRLDRRGTRPGDPTLVASPRRVALHSPQRDRSRAVATSTLTTPCSGIGALNMTGTWCSRSST